jgi:hypothetical protein
MLVPYDDRPVDAIPLRRPNEMILGSGSVGNRALFISERYGIVSVLQHGLNDRYRHET